MSKRICRLGEPTHSSLKDESDQAACSMIIVFPQVQPAETACSTFGSQIPSMIPPPDSSDPRCGLGQQHLQLRIAVYTELRVDGTQVDLGCSEPNTEALGKLIRVNDPATELECDFEFRVGQRSLMLNVDKSVRSRISLDPAFPTQRRVVTKFISMMVQQ